MFVPLLICFLILAILSNAVSLWMKMRVNEELPADRRLSWWSRDFREVNRLYRASYPDSTLPDLDRYGGYVLYALFAVLILAGILSRD